ncbi:PREDICTED: uncharacterized protein LOC107328315 [Acropora digitifera]|uniref:uncharacterized protein LOC107328315 n=1 Tax=Acropora digitifera TaxID=70779 RepID=UPI00077AEBC2|nr:PREDICTED: uncharacterized protein LOC107328315 [Acropora digitifera]XP_015748545.1 PREDICTED: uncharacterized protein LOC107328315 [Acropora digitifera]
MAKVEEDNKELDRNLQEVKQKLEKKKAKCDALDKEHKDLQDLRVKLKRMEDFQIQLFNTVKELEGGVKDLESQQEMKKSEFKSFKEKVKIKSFSRNSNKLVSINFNSQQPNSRTGKMAECLISFLSTCPCNCV